MKIKQNLYFFLCSTITNALQKKAFTPRHYIELRQDQVYYSSHNLSAYADIDAIEISVVEHLLSSTVLIKNREDDTTAITQLKKDDSFLFKNVFNNKRGTVIALKQEKRREEQRKKDALDYIAENRATIQALFDDWQHHEDANTYFSSHIKRTLQQRLNSIKPALHSFEQYCHDVDPIYKNQLEELSKISTSLSENIDKRNTRFERDRLDNNQTFFDHLEAHPLTPEQRHACVVDDNYNLIIASAGSGKTSVIAGKAGLLIKNKEVSEDELLMLSFAKDASNEINDRIQQRLIKNTHCDFDWAKKLTLEASTFHALGCHIIKASCEELGKTPPKVMAKQEDQNVSDIKNQLVRMLSENEEQALLIAYLASHQKPSKSELEFETITEYVDQIEASNLKTLQGEQVRSFEEFTIANYLYLNGITYLYEKSYPHDISMVDWHRDYKPDFTILQGNITVYFEHFGVDEHDKPPHFFKNPEDYVDSMRKKVTIHDANNTVLVQSKSYEMRDGTLEANLRHNLEKEGIVFSERTHDDVIQNLKSHKALSDLASLLSTFLSQFKSAQLSLDELHTMMQNTSGDKRRADAFYRVFEVVYEHYEDNLNKHNKIDFNDMINRAIGYIHDGAYISPYKRILVDEFQDISKARLNLVKALIENGPEDTRAFFVGDDFQAIFAFTGCDIAYIKYFEEYFSKEAQTRELYKTFRFNNKIGEVAKQFIEKNTFQKEKPIITQQEPVHSPMVSLVKTSDPADLPIDFAMKKIIAASGLDKEITLPVSILILTRFRKDKEKEDKDNIKQLKVSYLQRYPNMKLEVMTCHASKGQGEDYVVILDLYRGGFPCEKVNDPLLDIIFAGDDTHGSENYPYAEERRLLYVALTRAKKQVYMVVKPPRVSPFIVEMLNDEADIDVIEDQTQYGDSNKTVNLTISTTPCPTCLSGVLEEHASGDFLCSNRYACGAKFKPCKTCRNGAMLPDGEYHTCSHCDEQYHSCQKCDYWMIPKSRKKDGRQFLGCIEYKPSGKGCNGTSRDLKNQREVEAELNESE